MADAAPRHLRLSLRSLDQLFNSLDPSPFYEKDLDADADQYLTSWAEELAPGEEMRLTVHVREVPAEGLAEAGQRVAAAIHHYFGERQRLELLGLHRLLRRGRASLVIGLCFLALCLSLSQALAGREGTGIALLREGLMIAGWVAMWRPLEIYLYDWWPLRGRRELYRRMSRMPVELRNGEH